MSGKFLIRVIISFVLVSLVVLTACSNASASKPLTGAPNYGSGSSGSNATSNPGAQPKNVSGKIKQTWITPVTEGDTLSIPMSEVTKNILVHFAVDTPQGKMPVMAYVFDGKTYVRANICPPCRSYNYSLENDILVCDTCGSRFKALNGEGVSGP